jgi:peptide/nickel transport system substrate-binding protein
LHAKKRSSRLLAALAVTALVAVAACGDDDDATAPTTTTGSGEVETTETTETTEPTAATDTEATTETSESTTTEKSSATTAAPATTATATDAVSSGVRTAKDNGEPVKGGTLVYGLEADTANGWAPYRSSLATSGYIPLTSITDSLFAVTADGEVVGNLVESVDHNADYTQWTMHLREGIKFQDGSDFNGDAVKFNMDSCIYSPLAGPALTTIESVEASGMDVTVNVRGGPWVAFPAYFVAGCGYQMSAQWLRSLPDIPQRKEGGPAYDAALAATPADGDPARPVGLGAFTFESYTPGNGNSFRAVRNDNYWRGPNGITGEDLPYLDAIEAVVAVDADGRTNGLRGGDFDVMMTANSDTISDFIDNDDFKVDSSTLYGDTGYAMLNVAAGPMDPEGKNASSPLLNVDCRRALASAIDLDRYVKERGAGLVPPANGPFPPGSMGYLEDTGYPKFDLDAARSEMDKCLAGLGTDHIEFSYNTTNDPFNVESNTLILSMWTDAFGDKVQAKITPIEQGQYIGLALVGSFNAVGWRSHSGIDPDIQRLWWQSSSALPLGTLALNFGRFQDPDMDAQLEIIKSNPDPAARKAAAQQVNRIFGEKVYNWWIAWTLWAIISQPYVNGVQRHVLPDGQEGIGLAFAGLHQTNQMWCDAGKCE